MNKVLLTTQHGVSLIELLIAMALTLFVIASVTSSYIASRKASGTLEKRIARQQDIRLAFTTLTNDLHKAGTFGCAAPTRSSSYNHNVVVIDHTLANSPSKLDIPGLRIAPARATNWLAGSPLIPLSELIEIKFGQGNATPISLTTVTSDGARLLTRLTARLPAEQSFTANTVPLALTSCSRLDLITAAPKPQTDAHTLQLNFAPPIPLGPRASGTQGQHEGSLTVMRYVSRAYLVGSLHGQVGLYQFEIGEDGNKTSPTLVAANITGLRAEFGNFSNCDNRNEATANSAASAPHFIRLTLSVEEPQQPDTPNSKAIRHYSTISTLQGRKPCAAMH